MLGPTLYLVQNIRIGQWQGVRTRRCNAKREHEGFMRGFGEDGLGLGMRDGGGDGRHVVRKEGLG